ncbi:hypothetical protein [Desulfobulbus sp.]|uniref:hypothetical protein n=1 Tax=Desulfobulbus sp. TaxID=895 RepID=UPI0027BAD7AA|nr:hypothetical protein [Desulfobulbus sp.]
MMPMSQNENDAASVVETAKNIVSLVATCIGLIVILIGLKYAVDIFQLIFAILESPSQLTSAIQQTAGSIGGSAFDLRLEGRSVPLANLMALAVYCCGALLIAWLTLALMHTGAKIVSLTAGDRRAVKQLLQSAFGRSLQPKSPPDDSTTRNCG